MSPEEKSQELIEKFRKHGGDYRTGNRNSYENAKACAIILCDEILNLKMIYNISGHNGQQEAQYWQQVKQIIESKL